MLHNWKLSHYSGLILLTSYYSQNYAGILASPYTNPDLSMNYVIDGMTIFNCGFKFQNATHADTVKQYEVWLDNLVQQ